MTHTGKPTEEERAEAREFLLKHLKPGDTVYTVLRHVSRSGMMRRISPVIIVNGEPMDIDWQVAKLGIWSRRYPNDGLIVEGCGMDMGFHVIYELSRVLFPDGFKVEGYGRNGNTSGWDNDGGYALRQKWL